MLQETFPAWGVAVVFLMCIFSYLFGYGAGKQASNGLEVVASYERGIKMGAEIAHQFIVEVEQHGEA